MITFEEELSTLLNRYSKENASNTPDFILAEYMVRCLDLFNETSVRRETWYGKRLAIGESAEPALNQIGPK